jgi:hypothetical protein
MKELNVWCSGGSNYRMSLSIIIAPESAAQISVEKPRTHRPQLTDHERSLLAFVRSSERQMATVWTAVNAVVREIAPGTRKETRRLRIVLLQVVNQLLHRGLLRRHERNFIKLAEAASPAFQSLGGGDHNGSQRV